MEPYARRANDALFDRAGVSPGTRLLDIACGSGYAASVAAARRASVAGLDASGALIAIARARTPGADFRVGDMFALPFGDDCFDVATSFNGIWKGCEERPAGGPPGGPAGRPSARSTPRVSASGSSPNSAGSWDASRRLTPAAGARPGPGGTGADGEYHPYPVIFRQTVLPRIFRETVLPGLAGEARDEALEILGRLEPAASTPGPGPRGLSSPGPGHRRDGGPAVSWRSRLPPWPRQHPRARSRAGRAPDPGEQIPSGRRRRPGSRSRAPASRRRPSGPL